MSGITFEALEKYGALSESVSGWRKELRLVSRNNREPRYDLREWSPGDAKASRGISFSLEEARILKDILSALELPESEPDGEGEGVKL